MNRYRRLMLAVIASVVLTAAASLVTWRVVAALSSGSEETANAATSEGGVPESPVPGGPGFYSMSVLEFVSPIGDCTQMGPELFNFSGVPGCIAEAPVSLPNGATVTKFVLYFWDNSTYYNLSASLYRLALDGSDIEAMAETSSAGSPGYDSSVTTVIDFPVIDQQAYAYYVEVPLPPTPDGDVRLRGIRVDYGYGVSLPLVTKQD